MKNHRLYCLNKNITRNQTNCIKTPQTSSPNTVDCEFSVGAHHGTEVAVVLEVREVVQQEEEQEQHEAGQRLGCDVDFFQRVVQT